jgi:hypothetical protein
MKFNGFYKVDQKLVQPVTFTPVQCEALFAALLVHDDLYPETSLPDSIPLDYTQEQLSQCYLISQQLWHEGISRKALCEITDKICKQGKLNEQDQYTYYCMRAKIKHLRFAYVMFDEKHRYPRVFHWMTAAMGHLQDVLKNPQQSSVWFEAFLVRLFLSKPLYSIAIKEISGFKPSTAESFQQYIWNEINTIRLYLDQDKVTSHEFHAMRIVISRQVSFYDNLKTLYPSDFHQTISKLFSTLNGLMGNFHDELIVRKFNKTQDYYKDTFIIPEEIRLRLKALTEKYN